MWQFTSEWFNKWFTQKFILLVFHKWSPIHLLENIFSSRSHTGVKSVPFSWSLHKNLTSVGSLKQAWRPRQLLSLSQISPFPNCYPCGPAPPAGGPVPDPIEEQKHRFVELGMDEADWLIWEKNKIKIMQLSNLLRPVCLWHICASFVLKCYLYQSNFSIHDIYMTQLHELCWQFHSCQDQGFLPHVTTA